MSSFPCQRWLFSGFLITAIPLGVRWYLTVLLICVSLMANDVEYLFMRLLVICVSSLEKKLPVHALCLFLNGWSVFLLPPRQHFESSEALLFPGGLSAPSRPAPALGVGPLFRGQLEVCLKCPLLCPCRVWEGTLWEVQACALRRDLRIAPRPRPPPRPRPRGRSLSWGGVCPEPPGPRGTCSGAAAR